MTSIITKDVDTSSQKKLLEIAAAHAKQQRSADEQAALAQGTQIEAAQKRFREAFWKEIDKHPDGSRIQADAHAAARALKALASEKPDKNIRTKRIKSVRESLDETEKKYRELINTAAKSAINDDAYLAAVLKAIKREPAKMKKKGHGGFSFFFKPDFDLSHLHFPAQTSFVLEPPFEQDADVIEETNLLIGIDSFPSADADSGAVFADCGSADAGYHMARAQLGGFLTIPAGFTTLTLQARIVDVNASVWAFAVGASWASVGGIAEVTSTANNSTNRHETSIAYVVAPVIFYAEDDFIGAHVINAEFPISSNGGDILVTAGLKCDTWAAGIGAAVSTNLGAVSKISVKIS
jgi:hypothetical protein